MMTHTDTEKRLTVKQIKALELALQGMSDGEIGKRCQVTRQTVNEWRNQNMAFMEALQNQRELLRTYQMDRLNALVDEGLEAFRSKLRGNAIFLIIYKI